MRHVAPRQTESRTAKPPFWLQSPESMAKMTTGAARGFTRAWPGVNGAPRFRPPTQSKTVVAFAGLNGKKMNGDEQLRIVANKTYTCDVHQRIPSVENASELLGSKVTPTVSELLDEIIRRIQSQTK